MFYFNWVNLKILRDIWFDGKSLEIGIWVLVILIPPEASLRLFNNISMRSTSILYQCIQPPCFTSFNRQFMNKLYEVNKKLLAKNVSLITHPSVMVFLLVQPTYMGGLRCM